MGGRRQRQRNPRILAGLALTESLLMKNQKPIAIHLDRLAIALKAQGVTLERHQLLEVAASAFGHRNSNETSKLSQQGALTPPSAQPIARVDLGDDSILIARDAATGLPYGIAQRFLEEVSTDRSKQFSPTPYGGIADLRRVALSETPVLTRPAGEPSGNWLAIVQTGYGHSGHIFFDYSTADMLATEIAAWCVEHWEGARNRNKSLPETTSNLTDLEVIRFYFEAWAGEECLIMEGQESLSDVIETLRNGILNKVGRSSFDQTRPSDGRYRAYPATQNMSEMPLEQDYISSHDTLEAAIAACNAGKKEYHDSAVADHISRQYWRASSDWAPQSMPELARSEDPDITTFHLDAKNLLQYEVADEMRRIADMVDDGYNQGDTKNRGWWWLSLSEKGLRDARSDGNHGSCARCDSSLDVDGFCSDESCPFSDYKQDDPRGWSGHPEMDPEMGYRFTPPPGITALRAARIQHAILSALENGIIDKEEAVSRLSARLGFSKTLAQAIVDGEHDGASQ